MEVQDLAVKVGTNSISVRHKVYCVCSPLGHTQEARRDGVFAGLTAGLTGGTYLSPPASRAGLKRTPQTYYIQHFWARSSWDSAETKLFSVVSVSNHSRDPISRFSRPPCIHDCCARMTEFPWPCRAVLSSFLDDIGNIE